LHPEETVARPHVSAAAGAMNRAPTAPAGAMNRAPTVDRAHHGRGDEGPNIAATAGAMNRAPTAPAGAMNRAPTALAGAMNRAPTVDRAHQSRGDEGPYFAGAAGPTSRAPTVGEVVRAFKARVTWMARRVGPRESSPYDGGVLWQRGYHEHIIRDPADLDIHRAYVLDNPLRWSFDRENPSSQPAPTSAPPCEP
jgi:hypothetical protein